MKKTDGTLQYTAADCRHRWLNTLNKGVHIKGKGSWTAVEDQELRELVAIHGQAKWSFIGKFLPGRVGKQCRYVLSRAMLCYFLSAYRLIGSILSLLRQRAMA